VNPSYSASNFDYANFEGCYVQNADGSTTATVQFGPAHTSGPQNGRLDWVVPNRAVSVTVNGVLISTSLWANWSSGSPPLYVVLLSFTVTNNPQTIVVSSATPTPTPTPTPATSVSLAWNANVATGNSNTNAVGYQLHTGFSSGNYTQTANLGNITAVTVPLQQSGSTNFFVVTAYNTAGIQSIVSDEVSAKAP
jgi:hypothetical protein